MKAYVVIDCEFSDHEIGIPRVVYASRKRTNVREYFEIWQQIHFEQGRIMLSDENWYMFSYNGSDYMRHYEEIEL